MSNKTDLLPCPICGKKVSIARTENEVGERWWFITRGTRKTTRCNCRLFLESEKFTCDWNDDYSLECRAKLVDKWNTRAAHGTLTAEQVEKAIHDCSTYASYDGCTYYASGIRLQAIADELNATVGNRACEYVIEDNMNESEGMGDVWFRCTNCDTCYDYQADDWLLKMQHCPKCGAKVKAVG